MQILNNLFQVGGDLSGITFDGKDAGNTYILKCNGCTAYFFH